MWEYPNEEGGKHDLYMDIGETIKFRVSNELFEESSPIGPPATSDKPSTSSVSVDTVKIPYKIEVNLTFHCFECFLSSFCSRLPLMNPVWDFFLGGIPKMHSQMKRKMRRREKEPMMKNNK